MSTPTRFIILIFSPIPIIIGYIVDFLKRKGITAVVDENLLYLVTHMYSVATGKPPHERIFSLGSVSGRGYGEYSQVLSKIASLGKKWGYGYVIATKIQSKETTNTIFKDFLNRLAEAINVGEDLETFLNLEQSTILVTYEADYTRVLEAIKLLLGIYTASISSAMFIVINIVLLSFFIGNVMTIIVSFLGTIAALTILVFLIRKSLPRQILVHDLSINIPEIMVYKFSLVASIAMSSIVSFSIIAKLGELSYTLIIFGFFLLVPGLIGRRIESNVKSIESFFIVFIRSLGLTYSTLRNYAQSIRSILASDLGLLTKHLRRLYSRLRNGIETKVAFLYFIGETGSETVRRGIDIFYDAIEAGGDPAKIGETLSITIQRTLNLRKQREQVARAFQGVIYVLNTLIVALAEFVFTLTLMLQNVFVTAGGTGVHILPFTFIEPIIIQILKVGLVFIITILNAFALQFARGGYIGAAWLHASILLILSGSTMIVASIFSQALYKMLQIPQLAP